MMSPAGRSATRPSTLAPEDRDDADWIAQRMVLDAGAQAARLRRQASAQAATICEVAERETGIIGQQASVQAAAIREAAEREAARLRSTVMKLSAGPGEVGGTATQVTENGSAPSVTKPAVRLVTKPARGPGGAPRQLVAARVAAAATAALLFFALTAAATEVSLHGFAFFVFRSAGTGETPGSGLQEEQGPGQPDAPKPAPSHLRAQPGKEG
jgi:hypothetical protein